MNQTAMTTQSSATLLGDIGGTNARFAILSGGVVSTPEHFATRDYASPLAAMRAFLKLHSGGDTPSRAVFAVAGPIKCGRVQLTNAEWQLDAAEIARDLDFSAVDLLNDFAAQGWALPALHSGGSRAIGRGVPEPGAPQAVIGAGTGFGMAVRIETSGGETVLVTEGGHASLAAETDAEDSVLRGLRLLHGHVSVERVLSGPGLVELYQLLAQDSADARPMREVSDIVQCGLDGSCPVSCTALEMFCGWLGSVAGDVALLVGALGGVYISGGVVTHFIDFLASSSFRARFEAKGRLANYAAAIPTYCVTHPDPAFLGLARYVSR
jgi:glucokinase